MCLHKKIGFFSRRGWLFGLGLIAVRKDLVAYDALCNLGLAGRRRLLAGHHVVSLALVPRIDAVSG